MRAALIVMTIALGAAGCDRTHMAKAYGQSVRHALKAQVIDPAAGERRAPEQGLDPEEAAIVSKGYRESLSPQKGDAARTPMVVVPTTNGAAMPPMLPARTSP
ncbi:MAG TPA: hypothetical protein VF997_04905 [Polyangia bacterium]